MGSVHFRLGQYLLRRRECENCFVHPNTKQINPLICKTRIKFRQKDDGQHDEGNDLFRIN
jgi:hypothetical protein